METLENKDRQKTNKDFIWLLIGALVLITGLILLKSLMQHWGMIG